MLNRQWLNESGGGRSFGDDPKGCCSLSGSVDSLAADRSQGGRRRHEGVDGEPRCGGAEWEKAARLSGKSSRSAPCKAHTEEVGLEVTY